VMPSTALVILVCWLLMGIVTEFFFLPQSDRTDADTFHCVLFWPFLLCISICLWLFEVVDSARIVLLDKTYGKSIIGALRRIFWKKGSK
jgi:hypothetical protein